MACTLPSSFKSSKITPVSECRLSFLFRPTFFLYFFRPFPSFSTFFLFFLPFRVFFNLWTMLPGCPCDSSGFHHLLGSKKQTSLAQGSDDASSVSFSSVWHPVDCRCSTQPDDRLPTGQPAGLVGSHIASTCLYGKTSADWAWKQTKHTRFQVSQ